MKRLVGYSINIAVLVLLYMGFALDITGAANVSLVVLWVFSILGIFAALSDIDPSNVTFGRNEGLIHDVVIFIAVAWSGNVILSGFFLVAALVMYDKKREVGV